MGKPVNEVRKDILGRKVVVTAVRAARPHDHVSDRPKKVALP